MEDRFLGRTGVKVSNLCFGTMSFGGDADEAADADDGDGEGAVFDGAVSGGAVDAELGEGFVGGDAGACGGVGDHGVLRLSSCGSM